MFAKFVHINHKDNTEFFCFAFSITEADKQFQQATGINVVSAPHIGCQVHLVPVGFVLMESGLFDSKSDCVRMIKQKGVRINGELVEDFKETLELGDFLNFAWIAGKNFEKGNLIVAKGKKKVWLKVESQTFVKFVE